MTFSIKIDIQNLFLIDLLSNKSILKNINLQFPRNCITALIGPAGSGKTLLLRCLNRMIDLEKNLSLQGKIFSDDLEITAASTNVYEMRRKFSIVLSMPTPMPTTIYENIALTARMIDIKKSDLPDYIQKCLEEVGLWKEVSNRLHESAFKLSGGQQQRLCIARALALKPEVIMFDESTSGLDPISTAEVENTIYLLKNKTTIIWVTNNVKQAARISDYTGFLLLGDLIEFNETDLFFTNPKHQKTEEYISGKFG